MNMKIPFFKKKSTQPAGQEFQASAEQILGNNEKQQEEEISPSLSFHPDAPIQPEDRYYFQFLLNELPPLKRNQVSISPIEIKVENEAVHAQVFFRHSLERMIKLDKTDLLLLGHDGKILAQQAFDLSLLGEIPPESARPWIIEFSKESLQIPLETIPTMDWQVAFKLKTPHSLDLSKEWESSLAEEQKSKLRAMVDGLTPPKVNEINLMGLQANVDPNGSLVVSLLIRNGQEKHIDISQLPLKVTDASGEEIAKGSFTLAPLQVKANTSKPWTFIFPKEMVLKESLDLSSWRVEIPTQS